MEELLSILLVHRRLNDILSIQESITIANSNAVGSTLPHVVNAVNIVAKANSKGGCTPGQCRELEIIHRKLKELL